jgi:hypothetical protein
VVIFPFRCRKKRRVRVIVRSVVNYSNTDQVRKRNRRPLRLGKE